jgi:hypothetical protein
VSPDREQLLAQIDAATGRLLAVGDRSTDG